MPWQFPANKFKPAISYLLIILAFALLVLAIYLFFKSRINALEKGHTSAWQTKGKTSSKENQPKSSTNKPKQNENHHYQNPAGAVALLGNEDC